MLKKSLYDVRQFASGRRDSGASLSFYHVINIDLSGIHDDAHIGCIINTRGRQSFSAGTAGRAFSWSQFCGAAFIDILRLMMGMIAAMSLRAGRQHTGHFLVLVGSNITPCCPWSKSRVTRAPKAFLALYHANCHQRS